MRHRLSYASVTATLALFIAIGGTTAVGAQALLTGRAVKDESLTGAGHPERLAHRRRHPHRIARLQRLQHRGARQPQGRDRARPARRARPEHRPQGPAGVGVTAATATGADVTGYQDLEPLAQHQRCRAPATTWSSRASPRTTPARATTTSTARSSPPTTPVGGGGVSVTAGATAHGQRRRGALGHRPRRKSCSSARAAVRPRTTSRTS